MKITINDDFVLSKIAGSGQCFRVKKFQDDTYRFIHKNNVLYMKEMGSSQYEISCTEEEWENIWWEYFDLDEDYVGIRARIPADDDLLINASEYGKGLRILRQDPWEMIITFIISQRKNIPAISSSVELLSEKYGSVLETSREKVYLFPAPEQFPRNCSDDLAVCKLGYRTPYIFDAVCQMVTGKMDLHALERLSDAELFGALKQMKGVGDKVANCICLFGYHRTAMAPIDVWIRRVIDSFYEGKDPFPKYGDYAGIMQQYMFYYSRYLGKGIIQ